MNIIPHHDEILHSDAFRFQGELVGVVPIEISLPGRGHDLVAHHRSVWKKLCEQAGFTDSAPRIVRLDMCPVRVNEWEYEYPILEVNVLGPECIDALCMAYLAFRDRLPLRNPMEMLKLHLINWAREKRILFLLTEDSRAIKHQWGPGVVECARRAEIEMDMILPEEFLRMEAEELRECAIWPHGDAIVGDNRMSQFPAPVIEKLLRIKDAGIPMLNSPIREEKLGDKFVLEGLDRAKAGRPILLHADVTIPNVAREDWVIKPRLGSSGNGLTFGHLVSDERWDDDLQEARNKRGTHFLSRRMQPMSIRFGGERLVMDMNVTYLAEGAHLTPLWGITRADLEENVRRRGTMNVSCGGGFSPFPITLSG